MRREYYITAVTNMAYLTISTLLLTPDQCDLPPQPMIIIITFEIYIQTPEIFQ